VKPSPYFITVLILGACSPDSGDMRGLALAGGSAPTGAPVGGAGSGVPGPAGSGASGTFSGVSGQGASGTGAGTGVAGAPITGTAGTGAAGSATGAAGQTAAAGGGGLAGRSGAAGAAGIPAAGSGGAAGGTGGTTRGTVTVQFTTVTYGGEYAPMNYGAVWFTDASGKFIKTAKRWAGAAHAGDLATWTKESGGWGSLFGGGGNAADMMDAMSSATLRTHQMHTVTWNVMDAMKQVVPDGEYVANIEVTESRARDRAGPVIKLKFVKGPMPQMVEMPNQMSFTGISLKYMP
jgi:hypothetical protein